MFRSLKFLLLASALSGFAGSALAQDAAPAAPPRRVDGEKILELLVARGVISKADADSIISQAEVEPAAPVAGQPPMVAGGVEGDVQTVPYVPAGIRNRIRDEVKAEVLAQARSQGWAAPNQVPDWVNGISIHGDVRVRSESIVLPHRNADRVFPNFQAINAGGGYDISPSNPNSAPFLNSVADRWRPRLRARLGFNARLDDWISTEIRIATGNDRDPVSTNQTLGASGAFSKYAIWLDRANIRLQPIEEATLVLGRAPNPFWTSDLLFDEDLNFDGVSAHIDYKLSDNLRLFGTGGAFPIFNSELNLGSNEDGAISSKDKYMLGGQGGAAFDVSDDLRFTLAAGYFHFRRVKGEFSPPCPWYQAQNDACQTDATAPQFIQFGNTLVPIRNIDTSSFVDANGTPNPLLAPQVQLFGLASKFWVGNLHAAVDLFPDSNLPIRFEADVIKNFGLDADEIRARPEKSAVVNNRGPDIIVPAPTAEDPDATAVVAGPWDGGDLGYNLRLTVGSLQRSTEPLLQAGRWSAWLGYKRIESDATLDAFTDSDFHLGGTNAKGYYLGGAYGIGKGTTLGARWFSAREIVGPPLSINVFHVDLTAGF